MSHKRKSRHTPAQHACQTRMRMSMISLTRVASHIFMVHVTHEIGPRDINTHLFMGNTTHLSNAHAIFHLVTHPHPHPHPSTRSHTRTRTHTRAYTHAHVHACTSNLLSMSHAKHLSNTHGSFHFMQHTRVVSCIFMSYVTHMNESCDINTHSLLSHATHLSEGACQPPL